ncbi:signal transduction histidine kinase [Amycolatopsis sulphurea]|uniref:histidine kinase n=1 Tax=Amycolatopsis sulphurea TaxID=76022 RepID=A0A2A9FCN3_9PSEU|nr:nitrate- and nitrite sensing domain-containing protein [Amycolatopsis sulphurea]PFG48703.1 signal transduction histidine kinase [Amycolatopsis sulphurea]
MTRSHGPGARWSGRLGVRGLGVRGRVLLLIAAPLVLVVLVAVPLVLGQLSAAGAAASTEDSVAQARRVGHLAQQLQREGLITVAFLADSSATTQELGQQQRAVDAELGNVRGEATPAVATALGRVASLTRLRQNVVHRGVAITDVAGSYQAVLTGLVDALGLVSHTTSDGAGARELAAVDSLLRANEQRAIRLIALIAATVSPGQSLVDSSGQRAAVYAELFAQQAEPDDAAAIAAVESDAPARRAAQLSGRAGFTPEVVSTAAQLIGQRDTAQNKVLDAIAGRADDRSSEATGEAWLATGGSIVLFGLVVALTVVVGRSITGPLRRLRTRAEATVVRAEAELAEAAALPGGMAVEFETEQPVRGSGEAAAVSVSGAGEAFAEAEPAAALPGSPASPGVVKVAAEAESVATPSPRPPGEVRTEAAPSTPGSAVDLGGEEAEVAEAFDRLRVSAVAEVSRQAAGRRAGAQLLAGAARRTRNLAGRQQELVEELRRSATEPVLVADLGRLGRTAARLRRTAEDLFVVSGEPDESRVGGPIELATALHSAAAEIDDESRVRIAEPAELLLAPELGMDLVLLFAELMENAAACSPPESPVDVHSRFLSGGDLLVGITDHGPGLPAGRLAEENRCLAAPDERAPAPQLGLAVVAQLALRHALTVQLHPSVAGPGLTARVTVPAALFTRDVDFRHEPEPVGLFEPGQMPDPVPDLLPAPAIAALGGPAGNGFGWFADPEPAWPEAESEPVYAWPEAEPDWPAEEPDDGFGAPAEDCTDRMPTQRFAPVAPQQRDGVPRRVPGAQLAPELRLPQRTRPPQRRGLRDPAAERATFDAFSDGVAKAKQTTVIAAEQGGQ